MSLISFVVFLDGKKLAPIIFSCCQLANLRYNSGLRKQINPIIIKQRFKKTRGKRSIFIINNF